MEKKNTILLTVIAVATLLVAVVGATFAYFTAQGGTTASRDIQVQTYTSDTSDFTVSKQELTVKADQSNFGKSDGETQTASGDATVTYTASTSGDATKPMCYVAFVDISLGDFVWQGEADGTNKNAENEQVYLGSTTKGSAAAELTLTVTKSTNASTETGTSVPSTTSNTSNVDVTHVSARYYVKSDGTFDTTGTYNTDASSTTGYEQKITPIAGKEIKDTWNYSLSLVKLDTDQQYNVNKTGSVKFYVQKVTCSGTTSSDGQ